MKVVLGLSGGVDSAVCAKLLKDQGHEVIGLFMQNWEDGTKECTAAEDLYFAEKIAKEVGIDFEVVNFVREYWENVFEYFLTENRAGRTPNPDILCNKFIKFDAFLQKAQELGADKIAMGHYAKVYFNQKTEKYELKIPRDLYKDQTYFLHALTQNQLSKVIFPLEYLTKKEVRKIAEDNDFINAKRKDSTGICFIGERNYTKFLSKYLAKTLGEIIDLETKKVIGQHIGLSFYTIGQSKTLGIGGVKDFPEGKWYVIEKKIAENKLIVSQNEEFLMKNFLEAKKVNWISGENLAKKFTCLAKVRYRDKGERAEVELISDSEVKVKFQQKIRGVTPGQSVVFYDGDICLGGGEIE